MSGAPFDVKFISFDDIRTNPAVLDDIDVILNVGDAYTAYTGGENWKDERILTAVKRFVHQGGGFIGVGEPAAYQWQRSPSGPPGPIRKILPVVGSPWRGGRDGIYAECG